MLRLSRFPLKNWREIYDYARWLYDRYAERMFQSLPWPGREALKMAYAGTLGLR